MATLIWSTPAQIDLIDIDDFYRLEHAEVADRFGNVMIAAAEFISEHPKIGTIIDNTDFRKWTVRKTPYVLLYRPIAGGVEILRIRHMHEDWKPR